MCTECNQVFRDKAILATHLQGKHGIGNGICCTDCGLTFKWRSSLSNHRKKYHSNN